ncbi:MAG: ABC transporter ATP-binding protein [Eubacterium sp.]|nr:ABC transporter ATP-binding protein [Eubacterium sp.]
MLLELKSIYKNYIQGNMEVPVLKDINLGISEGEYVAIMGPSGSGKSTLMNIIGCLDQPTSGEYFFEDEEISNFNDRKLSELRNKKIGFVFQNFNLLPRQSALQNVELPLQYAKVPRGDRRAMCEEALIKVGLAERMTFEPNQLSGGQKQRVAIARAMVNKPSILLADEPTGALDSKSGIQVMRLFRELHEGGVTIIMITHSREIAEHADRIITIFDGEIQSDEINTEIRIPPEIPETDTAEKKEDAGEVTV